MTITNELIALIKSEETLFVNAVLVAKYPKSLSARMEELKELIISLADEHATPWLSFSLATIVLDNVNWGVIVNAFENGGN